MRKSTLSISGIGKEAMTGVMTKSRIVLLESLNDSLLVPICHHIYLQAIPKLFSCLLFLTIYINALCISVVERCDCQPSFTFATKSKMIGMIMKFMGKGLPTAQALGLVMGTLHKEFIAKDIQTFEDFHNAILDVFSAVNAALPGKHYDAPSLEDIKECFRKWEGAEEDQRKDIVIDFMQQYVNLNKLDEITLIAGVATPPAAMAAKRAGECVPQLKLIKNIPDVIFVPTATILALVSVKLSRRMFLRKIEES